MAILRNKLKSLLVKSRALARKKASLVEANCIQTIETMFVKKDFTKSMRKFGRNTLIGAGVGAVSSEILYTHLHLDPTKLNDEYFSHRLLVLMLRCDTGATFGGWVGAALTSPKKILPITGLFLFYNDYRAGIEAKEFKFRGTGNCRLEKGPDGNKIWSCDELGSIKNSEVSGKFKHGT